MTFTYHSLRTPVYSFIISSQGWFLLHQMDEQGGKCITTYGDVPKNAYQLIAKPCEAAQVQYDKIEPITIDVEMAQKILCELSSEDVVYTGAGLSRAANIPTFDDLRGILSLNDIKELNTQCDTNPKGLINSFFKFVARLHFSSPTSAHWRIHQLVEEKQCNLLTENLDTLHQKCGTLIISAFSPEVDDIHSPRIAFLLGVGDPSRKDLIDKWHTNGTRIIAVSLREPYLGDNINYEWVCTDVQKFVELRYTN